MLGSVSLSKVPETMGKDEELSAKVVVLGDSAVGKSTLVNAMVTKSSIKKASDQDFSDDEAVFKQTVIPAGSGQSKFNVRLKIWEYSTKQTKEESELILRNALFCIIIFDLRSSESANSAFNNWLLLREKFMPESFLFVVGTHLDMATARRVEASDLCKACAQNDGMYLEVSNTEGTNRDLLWRLIRQRINVVADIRKKLHNEAEEGLHAALDSDGEEFDPAAEHERKRKVKRDAFEKSLSETDVLDTQFLEGDVVCESVGSILSSTLGVDFWPGYENQEKDLRAIGENIAGHVRNISLDPSSAPKTNMEFVLRSVPAVPPSDPDIGRDPSPEELERAFAIMNFTLPPSLLEYRGAGARAGPKKKKAADGASGAAASSRPDSEPAGRGAQLKVNICLPSGVHTDMIIYPGYHLGRQIEAFLLQHNMEDDDAARHKLVNIATQLSNKYFAAHPGETRPGPLRS